VVMVVMGLNGGPANSLQYHYMPPVFAGAENPLQATRP
jgi:hypothetical protein